MAWLAQNIALGAEATATMDVEKVRVFFESSKEKDPAVRKMRGTFSKIVGLFLPRKTQYVHDGVMLLCRVMAYPSPLQSSDAVDGAVGLDES
jgi:hypothetical protein